MVMVSYEMRFKTEGSAEWQVFNKYKSKDDPELLKYFKIYKNHRIITDVEVIEIVTTRTKIDINTRTG